MQNNRLNQIFLIKCLKDAFMVKYIICEQSKTFSALVQLFLSLFALEKSVVNEACDINISNEQPWKSCWVGHKQYAEPAV